MSSMRQVGRQAWNKTYFDTNGQLSRAHLVPMDATVSVIRGLFRIPAHFKLSTDIDDPISTRMCRSVLLQPPLIVCGILAIGLD